MFLKLTNVLGRSPTPWGCELDPESETLQSASVISAEPVAKQVKREEGIRGEKGMSYQEHIKTFILINSSERNKSHPQTGPQGRAAEGGKHSRRSAVSVCACRGILYIMLKKNT